MNLFESEKRVPKVVGLSPDAAGRNLL